MHKTIKISFILIAAVAVLICPEVLTATSAIPAAEIPISTKGDVVVISIKLEPTSRPLNFMVDTGSEITLLDTHLALSLNLPTVDAMDVETIGGEATVSAVEINGFRIGTYKAIARRVATYDLSGLAAAVGLPIDGVLGIDILSRFSFTIDYTGKKMDIWHSGASGPQVRGFRIPLIPDAGGYSLLVRMNESVSCQLLLDTGANMTELPWTISQVLIQTLPTKRVLEGVSSTEQKDGQTYLARLESLEIGNLKIASPVVRFVLPRSTGTFAEKDAPGLLGSDLLQHFTITIDIPHRQAFFVPASNFHEDPLEFSSIGIQFLKKGKELFIVGIWAGTPADQLNLQRGDQIIELDRKPVDDLSSSQIERMLRGPEGTTVRLKIRRKASVIELRVPRRKLI